MTLRIQIINHHKLMKTRLFSFAAIAAALLAAASCSLDSITTLSDAVQPQEIGIRTLGSAPGTKSAIDGTAFPQGYDMMVSAYKNIGSHAGEDASADYFEGIQFAYDGTSGSWKSTKGPKYWPLDGTLDFLAVASAGTHTSANGLDLSYSSNACTWGDIPGNAANNVAKKVVLNVPDNSEKFDDLLYGAANAQGASASGTGIAFRHAMASVVFVAKCNVAYDADENKGITIDGITIDGAKYSGTLTVANPAAGGGSGDLTAAWSSLGSTVAHLSARVWNSGNSGIKTDEPALSALHLGTTYKDISAAANRFGEAYVILPGQAAVPFTVTYTIHNGFEADGTTPKNNQVQYQYTPSGTWQMGKKYVYQLDFNLTEILVNPTVVNWEPEASVAYIPKRSRAFADLYIAPAPLYYNGTTFTIKDNDWNHDSFNDTDNGWGKRNGSYYFSFHDLCSYFSSTTDGSSDIDNIHTISYGGYDDWRVPTVSEWQAIISTTRAGSKVNDDESRHYAVIQLTGVNHANNLNPSGLLLFPDGEDISGKALSYTDCFNYTTTGFTADELTVYLNQGCVFIPFSGSYASNSTWHDGRCFLWLAQKKCWRIMDGTGEISTPDIWVNHFIVRLVR